MGLFKKLQEGISGAVPSTDPQAVAAQQRAMGIDTANFGGPSNAPVADDDPIWEPIEGIDLPTYARVAKAGQAHQRFGARADRRERRSVVALRRLARRRECGADLRPQRDR